ncbi:hypothetical protein [Streptomyces cyaneofuscatus]
METLLVTDAPEAATSVTSARDKAKLSVLNDTSRRWRPKRSAVDK